MWTRVIKPVLEWLSHFETIKAIIYSDFFRITLLPLVWTVLTALGGYVQGLPIMWVMVGTAASFTLVVLGMAGVWLLKQQNTPQNRLVYNVIYQGDLTPANPSLLGNRHQRRTQARRPPHQQLSSTQLDPNVTRTIDKGQLGIEVTNNALFPISCILQSAKSEIEGFEPPRTDYPKLPVVIAAGQKIRICDEAMQMDQFPCQRLAGEIDLVVKYGLPGKEHFELHVKGPVAVVMEHYGHVSAVTLSLG
jgi:hypothetical protein